MRLKNFVVGAEIINNVIEDCGVTDYVYGSGNSEKNGEGIYVGTSSRQVGRKKERMREGSGVIETFLP